MIAGESARPNGDLPPVDVVGLGQALGWLDECLRRAVARARDQLGNEPGGDRFRGLYVADADIDRLFGREAAAPLYPDATHGDHGQHFGVRFDWLSRRFQLSPRDREILLLALAPDLDLRYERLYAYLQDDITRKRPTVDLALSLFTTSQEERIGAFAHFLGDAPLFHHELLELIPDPATTRPPLLAHALRLDEQILLFLLDLRALDRRLTPYVTMTSSAKTTPDGQPLGALMKEAHDARRPLRLYVEAPPGSSQRAAIREAAAIAGQSLLECSTLTFPTDDDGRLLRLLAREASLQDAVILFDDVETVAMAAHSGAQVRLHEALEPFQGTLILAGAAPWVPGTLDFSRVVPFPLSQLSARQRADGWGAALTALGCRVDETALEELGARYRFSTRQIEDAAALATTMARARTGGTQREKKSAKNVAPTPGELALAARRQTGHSLATLATRIEPVHRWSDLVLPDDVLTQLRELLDRVLHRDRVLDSWGFGSRFSRGKGVNALFSGPSGTGKTMGAEIIAGELGLDLFRVELAGVVSKYIGETERNLDRIFAAAERTDGIVFFDEADALFGKRSEVHDSHDRYANLEISYLLQRMEEYEGVAILSTNLRGNLDQAFVRRLALTVHFPFPDEIGRRAIWRGVWPERAPLAEDVDLDALASRFALSGGNIRNVALAAGFLAASDGGRVTMAHLLQAVTREYEKVGKRLTDAELLGKPEPESARRQ